MGITEALNICSKNVLTHVSFIALLPKQVKRKVFKCNCYVKLPHTNADVIEKNWAVITVIRTFIRNVLNERPPSEFKQ